MKRLAFTVLLLAGAMPAFAAPVEGRPYEVELRKDYMLFNIMADVALADCSSGGNFRFRTANGTPAATQRLLLKAFDNGGRLRVTGTGTCIGGVEVASFTIVENAK